MDQEESYFGIAISWESGKSRSCPSQYQVQCLNQLAPQAMFHHAVMMHMQHKQQLDTSHAFGHPRSQLAAGFSVDMVIDKCSLFCII